MTGADAPGVSRETLPLLRALWAALAPARRRRALRTLAVMLAAGTCEFMMLLAARHFLGHLLGPFPQAMAGAAILFALTILLVAAARLATVRLQDGLVLGFASDASIEIFSRALRQPYLEHKTRRSAELFVALENTQRLVNMALGPMLVALVNGGLALALLAYLLTLAPAGVSAFLALLALAYWVIGRLTGASLRSSSQTLHDLALRRLQAIHETQADFRDLVLSHAQQRELARFRDLEAAYRTRQARDRFATAAPRHLVEMTLMLLAVGLACVLATGRGGIMSGIPVIGVVALGLQRLMPLIHGCHSGWAQFQANSATIAHVLELMRRPVPALDDAVPLPLAFKDRITLSALTLGYPDRGTVLRQIDLVVRKGERVGIIGPSGAGKSSLVDILMGLVEPSSGDILVDAVPLDTPARRRAWQRHLSSVSQHIYLSDTSLREAIVDGDAVDEARLRSAIEGAQLAQFVASLPSALDTRLGDGGLLISGGQRQRVALARALYRQTPVLVLDEATSQLDAAAEEEIMKVLQSLDRSTTLLLITHRLAALAVCDRVLELRDGALVEIQAEKTT